MKKALLSMILMMVSVFSFAQWKNVQSTSKYNIKLNIGSVHPCVYDPYGNILQVAYTAVWIYPKGKQTVIDFKYSVNDHRILQERTETLRCNSSGQLIERYGAQYSSNWVSLNKNSEAFKTVVSALEVLRNDGKKDYLSGDPFFKGFHKSSKMY